MWEAADGRRTGREGGGGREADGLQNQKQEPHTKMWGKMLKIARNDPSWPEKLLKTAQNCLKLLNVAQSCSKLRKIVQICSKLLKIARNVSKCLKMSHNGPASA